MLYMQVMLDWLYHDGDIHLLNMPFSQIMVNTLIEEVPFAWVLCVTLLLQNSSNPRRLTRLPISVSLIWMLKMPIKIRLTRKWGKRGENQNTHLNRVEIFRWLLRNRMNEANVDGVEAK